MNGFKSDRRPGLQIDGLPDARGSAVTLLAFQLEFVRRIVDPQDQTMSSAVLDMSRNVKLERRIASLVVAQQISVEPGGCVPIATLPAPSVITINSGSISGCV